MTNLHPGLLQALCLQQLAVHLVMMGQSRPSDTSDCCCGHPPAHICNSPSSQNWNQDHYGSSLHPSLVARQRHHSANGSLQLGQKPSAAAAHVADSGHKDASAQIAIPVCSMKHNLCIWVASSILYEVAICLSTIWLSVCCFNNSLAP